tara:strand:- start:3409 stop:3663 length:255 start_codon:yes stop_codon:yes gene_type:complete
MTLQEREFIGKIEVLDTGTVQVRKTQQIFNSETGEIKSSTFSRSCFETEVSVDALIEYLAPTVEEETPVVEEETPVVEEETTEE